MAELVRLYGAWAGNPKGTPEDPARCLAEIRCYGGWLYFQCSRKRGHGPREGFCKQHAKMIEGRGGVYVPGPKEVKSETCDSRDG